MNRYRSVEIANFTTPVGTITIMQEYTPPIAFKALVTAEGTPQSEYVIATANVYKGDTNPHSDSSGRSSKRAGRDRFQSSARGASVAQERLRRLVGYTTSLDLKP